MPGDRARPDHIGAQPVPTFASPQTHPPFDRGTDPPPCLTRHGGARALNHPHSHALRPPTSPPQAPHESHRLQYEQTPPAPPRLPRTVLSPFDSLVDHETNRFSGLVRCPREIEPSPPGYRLSSHHPL